MYNTHKGEVSHFKVWFLFQFIRPTRHPLLLACDGEAIQKNEDTIVHDPDQHTCR